MGELHWVYRADSNPGVSGSKRFRNVGSVCFFSFGVDKRWVGGDGDERTTKQSGNEVAPDGARARVVSALLAIECLRHSREWRIAGLPRRRRQGRAALQRGTDRCVPEIPQDGGKGCGGGDEGPTAADAASHAPFALLAALRMCSAF